MSPAVGSTCAFIFTTPFAALNGVYTVISQTPFLDCVKAGVDFAENLYVPAGLSANDYVTDYSTYTKDIVSVLQSVGNSSSVFYVPESIFGKVPDPTVREYLPLTLVLDLGVQSNTQMVLPLIDAVTDLTRASLGTTNPVRIITNSDNKVYLTDTEYAALETARAANKQVLSPLSVQLQAEKDKNAYLAAKVAAYEALIQHLGDTAP